MVEVHEIPEPRPTKARMRTLESLLETAVRRQEATMSDLRATQDARHALSKELDEFDAEARAISECVKALERVVYGPRGASYVYVADEPPRPPSAAELPVGRVLLHLAQRFGVPLT